MAMLDLPRASWPVVAATAIAAFAGPAAAQDGNGRYTMAPVADGYLKLDSRTGSVTHCQRDGTAFRCSLVPDERNALQDEIDRLSRENAELKARLAGNGGSPSVSPPAAAPPSSSPSEEDIDRALSLMERFLRRFKDIVREPEDGKPL